MQNKQIKTGCYGSSHLLKLPVCKYYLHGDQCLVDSLSFHQLAVSSHLYNLAIFEAGNNISVSDC